MFERTHVVNRNHQHKVVSAWLRKWNVLVAVGLVFGPGLTGSLAQGTTATLSGTVMDASGGVLPEVTVTLLSVDQGLQRQVTSNAEGFFVFPLVQPGRYTLTASRQGFAPLEIPDIVLHVNDQLALQIKMKVGTVEQKVTVTGGTPLINTESATVSTVVDRQFAENLPMNGRSFQTLIELTPGVVLTPPNGRDPGQFSVNGQRPVSNYWMIDGVSANVGVSVTTPTGNGFGGAALGFTAQGGTNGLISVDAMQGVNRNSVR